MSEQNEIKQDAIVQTDTPYVVEMLGITKEFSGLKANDNISLCLKKGEIHALLGENGAGKSTLMSILFGLYQKDAGTIKINGQEVQINDPNDATKHHIGMVHQHFKLVEVFTVLQNIILGSEPTDKLGFIHEADAKKKVEEIIEKTGLSVDLNEKVENITVGMQQRVEILKMLYRQNDILIFDEPTAVLTPQEIDELMSIMRILAKEGKSILFITHKLNEIMAVADCCTVLRKGMCMGTVDIKDTTREQLSEMMVGRKVMLVVDKKNRQPGEVVLSVQNLHVNGVNHKKEAVKNVSFEVRRGEIVCIAGIDGNGQTELASAITGLTSVKSGTIKLKGHSITNMSIRKRNLLGLSHIPQDRHKYGLVLDFSLEQNMVLQRYFEPKFQHGGFVKFDAVREYANQLIEQYDVRSSSGAVTVTRNMSGGNQQKAIVAREVDRGCDLLIAVQPTRGLDVGAIEYIHNQLVKQRDEDKGVLLVSLELDEVMSLPDRILVIYEGEIVGEFKPQEITVSELGLYMAGVKRFGKFVKQTQDKNSEEVPHE